MPIKIEHEGKEITVYTQEELDAEVKGLKVTNQNLKDEKQELADKLKTIDAEKRDAEEAKAKRDGDYEKLERLMNERIETERAEREKAFAAWRKEKVGNALNDIVTELGAGGSRNEDLRDLLKSRFEFDYDHESGKVTVSGDNVASLDDLRKLVKDGDRYAAYVAGSQASGGGAAGSKGTGVATKKFNEMSGAELAELRKDNPQEYDRLKTEFYGK